MVKIRAGRLVGVSCGLLASIVAGAGWSTARADSLGDDLGVRALGQGEAVRAAAWGAAATRINPAGAALTRAYAIEGTFGFRPDDGGTIAGASICDSVTSRVAACVYYSYIDSTPEGGETSLHDVGLSLAVPLADKLMLGVTGRYVDYSETGVAAAPEDNSRDGAFVMDAGLILRIIPELALAGVGYNLVGHDDDNFPRGLGAGLALTLADRFTLGTDAVWNLDAAEGETGGRYGVGAEFFASADEGQQGYPIRAGYVYDAGRDAQYVTGGLGFMTPRVGLEVGLRQQVAGEGDELTVQFGLRLMLPQ
jgi:hypothetical protein